MVILCLFGLGRAEEEVLAVVGGAVEILLQAGRQGNSLVSDQAELVGCSSGPRPLPGLPAPVFGSGLAWQGGKLWSCGGSNWAGPTTACLSWRPGWVTVVLPGRCDTTDKSFIRPTVRLPNSILTLMVTILL